MGVALATGQGAGVAAALCAQRRVTPRQLDYHLVQQELILRGARLFDEEKTNG